MTDPLFLDCEAVIGIHDLEIAESGGLAGIRDRNALESAVANPRQRQHYDPSADLVDLAASYLFAIAKGHGFNDANKRTAYVSCLSFLDMNGINLGAPIPLEFLTLAVANNLVDQAGLTGMLRQMVRLQQEDPDYYEKTYYRRQTPARGSVTVLAHDGQRGMD